MNAKFCLLLVAGLLVGALALGNPFLRGVPMRMQVAPKPIDPAPDDAAARPNVGAVIDASFLVSAGDVECPDRDLVPEVVRVVRLRDGQPAWVLRDGRCLRRNPTSASALPLIEVRPGQEDPTR